MIGPAVGNYTLVEKLGQGGMGEVYLAEHRRIGRRAAIKFLLPAFTQDAEVVNRFFNEARATSLIKHPGIVEIYDCDVIDGRAYIVMEYLEGESLAAALQRTGPLAGDPIAVTAVIGQLASALAAAHRKEIIHRDLKPENVFLSIDESGRTPFVAKILDFGIAKLAAPGVAGGHTRTGGLLGTPVYMAPEQCRGLATIDRRADIYALGCVLFEMATGRHVFVKESAGDLLVAHITETPPRISALRPEIPSWLDDLTDRMLAKRPDDRPTSMAEIVSAAESFLQVPAAEFATRVPRASVLARLPPVKKRPSAPMTVVRTSTPESSPLGAAFRSAKERPASPRINVPVSGGTRLLPEGGVPAPGVKALNDSTFRRSASELLAGRPELRSPRRKAPILTLVGGGLVLAGGAAFFLTPNSPVSRRPAPSQPGPSATPPAPPALAAEPAEEPKPIKATIHVVSHPPGAELWLSNEPASRGATPLDLVVPQNAAPVPGVLKADGFRDAALTIDPGRAGPVVVEMERIKIAAPHRPSSHHHAEKHAPDVGPAPPAPPSKKPSDGFFGVGD